MLFDTHTHLNDEQFDEDRDEVIARAWEMGVRRIVNIGYNRETITTALALAERYDWVYAAIGWHPNDALSFDDEAENWLKAQLKHPKVVAVGEIGLDYHWDDAPPEVQKTVFKRQIRLAKEFNLPIVIHDREAHQDVLDILRETDTKTVGGIMHSFSGSWEMARDCMALGFYISLGGPVTFKNAKKPKEIAAQVPLDRLLIETDSPYLTPTPYRGKRNESGYVKYVAQAIAELRSMSYEELAEATYRNANRVFKLAEE
jgi:TatD DNase family protein